MDDALGFYMSESISFEFFEKLIFLLSPLKLITGQ